MSVANLLRHSILWTGQSILTTRPFVYSSNSLKRTSLMTTTHQQRHNYFRKEAATRSVCQHKHNRKYCVNNNSNNSHHHQKPNETDSNQNGRQRKSVKYLTGFLGVGVCGLLAVFAVLEYWKRQYRRIGIEPVISRRYGWRFVYYYGGYMLPAYIVDNFIETLTFQVREDDVWIIGFPKSGTNWLQEVVNLVGNGADFSSVQSPIEYRVPCLEFPVPGVKFVDTMTSPRYIKTHMPFSIMPSDYHKKKPKTIYIARNPKDLIVSFHYFFNQFFAKKGFRLNVGFDDLCQLFLDGEVFVGPWWKHVMEGWKRRDDHNVLYITYEDMKSDLPASVRKIAAFLDKKLSDEDIDKIVSHCSFDSMKKNTFVNKQWYKDCGLANKDANFLRKGKVGDWKNHLSKEMEGKLDEMLATKLEPLGISFRDSLAESDI